MFLGVSAHGKHKRTVGIRKHCKRKADLYHRDEFIINKIKVSDPELEYKKYVKAKNAALWSLGSFMTVQG